mmetsp:Transcript_29155/g.69452  ORF Transcript_29155/g.69452 Transcript_29155/m.69452 type:complete len:309 (+) Transcript_29155:4149-5075(+)
MQDNQQLVVNANILSCSSLGAEVVAGAAEGFAAAPAGLARLPLAVVACGADQVPSLRRDGPHLAPKASLAIVVVLREGRGGWSAAVALRTIPALGVLVADVRWEGVRCAGLVHRGEAHRALHGADIPLIAVLAVQHRGEAPLRGPGTLWAGCAHDVLRGVRPCNCGLAVGPGPAHRGHHGAVQRALRARGARVAGHHQPVRRIGPGSALAWVNASGFAHVVPGRCGLWRAHPCRAIPSRRAVVGTACRGGVGNAEGALGALLGRVHAGWVHDGRGGARHTVVPRRAHHGPVVRDPGQGVQCDHPRGAV